MSASAEVVRKKVEKKATAHLAPLFSFESKKGDCHFLTKVWRGPNSPLGCCDPNAVSRTHHNATKE